MSDKVPPALPQPVAAPDSAGAGAAAAAASGSEGSADDADKSKADQDQDQDQQQQQPPLPPGFENTTQRLIRPTGPLPTDEQTQVALDENVIADHYEEHLMADDNEAGCKVFSALLGGIHLYCFPPSQQLGHNFWTVCTMGISGTKMRVPEGVADPELYQHVELLCFLPPNWFFPAALGSGEMDAENWPLEMLRSIGNYVSTTGAWISHMHGIPNLYSNPPGQTFYEGTKLAAMLLLEPVMPEPFLQKTVGENVVRFLMVVPLTQAEAQWKRDVGAANSIFYVLGDKQSHPDSIVIGYVIDPLRPCAVEDLHCDEQVAQHLADKSLSEDDDDDEGDEDENGGNQQL